MFQNHNEQDKFQQLSQLLAEWNPIGVPEGIAEDEYKMYVPRLLRFNNDYDGLLSEMKKIATEDMGLEWEYFYDEFKDFTALIAAKIVEVLKVNSAKG